MPVVAATNAQLAGRVDPTLGDPIAALATGAVGSFALVRDDVSDTPPGVAIAISLVPPLAVVGLTLESGAPKQALGALLLFLTNFGAILLTGLIVMAVYRVRATAMQGLWSKHGHPRAAVPSALTDPAFIVTALGFEILGYLLAYKSGQFSGEGLFQFVTSFSLPGTRSPTRRRGCPSVCRSPGSWRERRSARLSGRWYVDVSSGVPQTLRPRGVVGW